MSLKRIALRDFVIVRELELDLSGGFSVLTGETGAGKSILIDAVQLALGARADAGVVREGAARADISIDFDLPPSLAAWLEEAGFESQDQLLLRRTIDSQGKSRAWINGGPATATQLRELGEQLVDIHGQHAWQSLTRADAVRALLERVTKDLRREGHEIAEHIPLGAMIEVPSAAIALPDFIDMVDFLSIGTNDLVQYLLAADRNNEALGELYTPLHPAVLRLLHSVISIANKRDKPIAVCGEMAADPLFAPLLLALGLCEFSLHPATLLEVRQAIRGCDLGALRARAPALLRARDRAGIEKWMMATF